jgi:hypothetical protein
VRTCYQEQDRECEDQEHGNAGIASDDRETVLDAFTHGLMCWGLSLPRDATQNLLNPPQNDCSLWWHVHFQPPGAPRAVSAKGKMHNKTRESIRLRRGRIHVRAHIENIGCGSHSAMCMLAHISTNTLALLTTNTASTSICTIPNLLTHITHGHVVLSTTGPFVGSLSGPTT